MEARSGSASELVRAEPGPTAEDKSIVLALGDETHTLGNALRDVMWSHPHVQLASYTQEHPSSTDILVRCQTSGAITAGQAVTEALHMTKDILNHMSATMDEAVQRWEQQHGPIAGAPGSQPQQQGGEAMEEDDQQGSDES